MSRALLDVALVHAPVVNRRGEVIGSAVTNLDLHDIARACRTFGVGTYWVITPFFEQRKLAKQIISHWTDGYGKSANPDRGNALSLICLGKSLEEVIADTRAKWGQNMQVIATCAKPRPDTVDYRKMRSLIEQGQPGLLLFGTAWGLAPEVFAQVDATLPPLQATGDYNHLSVRSAASIILDRLLGDRG
ncbi:MAG TPA: RNA methyltransferase [Desulfobulbaceae bacterium]|nr:RNA methyltransferase [Desulfobulbaceae bacterium]